MKSMLESYLTLEQTELLAATLEAQTRASGSVEAPLVAGMLAGCGCRDVLDIGTGEGSFLLEVARRVPAARYLGVDHNRFAIAAATRRLRGRARRNVRFESAFFDRAFDGRRRDAILTRYTLQHCTRPGAFAREVFARLERRGTFVAVESVESAMGCHVPDATWEAYRDALLRVHAAVRSDADRGKALGSLFRRAGFRDVRVAFVLTSPVTVGVPRFRALVLSTTAMAHRLFPAIFPRSLVRRMDRWLQDADRLARRDPYVVTAIARGVRP